MSDRASFNRKSHDLTTSSRFNVRRREPSFPPPSPPPLLSPRFQEQREPDRLFIPIRFLHVSSGIFRHSNTRARDVADTVLQVLQASVHSLEDTSG